MEIAEFSGEINELYELWLTVSKDRPYTEKLDIDVFKSSYLENIMAENICYLAREDGKLKGSAMVHIYTGWSGAVLQLFVPREDFGSEMSIALLTEAIELCRMREVPQVSPKGLAGCPWYTEFFIGQNFVNNEKYPEGLWMRQSLEEIPDLDDPEGVIMYYSEKLDESNDLEGMARLEKDIALEAYDHEIDMKKSIEALEEEMQGNNVVYGIAKRNSEIIGYSRTLFVELLSGGSLVKNQGLAVKEEYRNKGIGAALLISSLSMVKDRGHDEMFISTHSKNPARFLFEKVGFETVEVVPNLNYKLG